MKLAIAGRGVPRPVAVAIGLAVLLAALVVPQLPSHAASGDPVIAAAGDIVCDPSSSSYNNGNGTGTDCTAKQTMALLNTQELSAILALGDNQYGCGGLSAYNTAYTPTWGQPALKAITHPVPGNHEYQTSGGTGCAANAAGYYSYYGSAAGTAGQGYYSFNVGAWHIIALNSHPCFTSAGCATTSPEGVWLKNDLAAHSGVCTLAYWHEPMFSSSPGHGNSEVSPFWQLLYAAKADIVLDGHDHWYERFALQNPSGQVDTANGIREFTVGTGGEGLMSLASRLPTSQASNDTNHGILKLTLHPSSYEWNFVPQAGDTFTDSSHGQATSCHASTGTTTTTVAPTTTTVAPTTTTVAPTTTTVAPTTTTTGSNPAAYRNVILGESSLLSYWRLGESSGTTVNDSKGSNNGTYVNGVTLAAHGAITNDPDTAATFNGTNNKISLPTLAPVTNFSIEGWTNLASGATGNINGNNALYATKGNVRLLARPGLGTATAAYGGVWLNGTEYVLQPTTKQSNLGTWVQWVLTRSGGKLTLYRNGVSIGTRTDLPATATANISGWIGAQSGTDYFLNGSIDEVSIYTGALSASAVAAHYNAGISGPTP